MNAVLLLPMVQALAAPAGPAEPVHAAGSAQITQAECLERAPAQLLRLAPPDASLVAVIAPGAGGALVGLELVDAAGGRQLLYRGMNFCAVDGFDGKAPILWPATGRTFLPATEAGTGSTGKPKIGWEWQGRRYPMRIHGFARDSSWAVVKASPNSVTVRLTDSAVTRLEYPFGFDLYVTYEVRGSTLTMSHQVLASAANREAMPFAIGNHIAFNVPSADAGRVLFTTPATRRIGLDGFGRPDGQTTPIKPFERMPITRLDIKRAVPVGGYPHDPWMRLDYPDGLSLRLSHRASRWPAGTPVQFTLWGNPAVGYISPEPWAGKQNALATGDGAIVLQPGERFTWTVTLEAGRSAGP